MLDHWSQIILFATAARRPVYIRTLTSYSLAYAATNVIDNLPTALSAHIQISIALIGMVRKPSVEPIILAKRWGITPEKAQKTIQAAMQRGSKTMLNPIFSRWSRTNDRNLCYQHLAHPVFSDTIFVSTVSRKGNRYLSQMLDGQ